MSFKSSILPPNTFPLSLTSWEERERESERERDSVGFV
jgi:hypothetical protein